MTTATAITTTLSFFFSLTYRDPSHVMPSRSFQRTFPLRKSTGSTSRASATPSSSVTTTTTATQGSLVIYNDSSDNEAKCEPIKVKKLLKFWLLLSLLLSQKCLPNLGNFQENLSLAAVVKQRVKGPSEASCKARMLSFVI